MARVDLSEMLRKGLRPYEYIGQNEPYLLTADNMVCTQSGLSEHETINQLIASGELSDKSITVSHPFPQVFKGRGVTLLCTQTKVYTVDESDWTLTALTTYDLRTPANTHAIPSGGVWQFADMHTYWMLFNGACVVMKTGWVDSAKVFVQDEQTMLAGCTFRGQLMMGGFDTDFWTSDWQTLWATWYSRGVTWGQTLSGPGQNWVWWSQIGGGDIGMLFLAELATANVGDVTGGHSTDQPLFLDFARRVESSLMPMDFQGAVMNMLPMKEAVVVYGADGVSALFPATPAGIPTFGLEDSLHGTGLASRGACCAVGPDHMFVDAEGVLWRITAGLQTERLGYQEFLSPMLGDNISMHYDKVRKRVHITDGEDAYVLSETGLTNSATMPTALLCVDGGLAGLFETVDDAVIIETNEIDLGSRQMKTLLAVEVMMDDPTGVTMVIAYKDKVSGSFTDSETFTLDTSGRTIVILSCIEFKIKLLCSDPAGLKIAGLFVETKEFGKTNIKRNIA